MIHSGGSKGTPGRYNTISVQFSSIACSFRVKNIGTGLNNYLWCPLGNPESATATYALRDQLQYIIQDIIQDIYLQFTCSIKFRNLLNRINSNQRYLHPVLNS